MKMRSLTVLGSTGSIGTQTLDIADQFPESIRIEALSCYSDTDLFIKQLKTYSPTYGVVVNVEAFNKLPGEISASGSKQIHNTEVFTGKKALEFIASLESIDTVVVAIVGNDALLPTWVAIQSGKRICLANKEVLVTAGHLIMPEAAARNVEIIPVDSEHSAVFQSLQGSHASEIEKVILTASGGPFRGKTRSELKHVKATDALKHPNWDMGKKITIDSATLMNKGLEVIEAKWLFQLNSNQIDVVVHPQSIIHSMIQYKDSSVISQMGLPDMRLPILYALSWPERVESKLERMDLTQIGQLTFEAPDLVNFPCLQLAYDAMETGGSATTVLNAANEVFVEAFLTDTIGFYDISDGIQYCLRELPHLANPMLEDVIKFDQMARDKAKQFIQTIKK